MRYAIKEMQRTIQGEGFHAGRPAILVRFSGCNFWAGTSKTRNKGMSCAAWCDTDFVGTDGEHGGGYFGPQIAQKASELWGVGDRIGRFLFLTGGEPMLQVDPLLIDILHRFEFTVAIETNGSKATPKAIDWITVSPKAGTIDRVVQRQGHELKVVYPQDGLDPKQFEDWKFKHFFLQPLATGNPSKDRENTEKTIDYCFSNPRWRVSIQAHKLIGVA